MHQTCERRMALAYCITPTVWRLRSLIILQPQNTNRVWSLWQDFQDFTAVMKNKFVALEKQWITSKTWSLCLPSKTVLIDVFIVWCTLYLRKRFHHWKAKSLIETHAHTHKTFIYMQTAAQAVRGGGSVDGCPGSCKTGLVYKKKWR